MAELTYEQKRLRYLANLELEASASDADIKNAYKRLLKEYHPDLFAQHPQRQQIALKISQGLAEAYQFLIKS